MKKIAHRQIFSMVFLCFAIFLVGCGPSGPSYEEQQAKAELGKKESSRQKEETKKRAIEQIINKYNAIYFPPKNLVASTWHDFDPTDPAVLRPDPFTYEFQEFFKIHSQEPMVFIGTLEDIERTKNGIIAKFVGSRDEHFYFRLTISESYAKQFLKRKTDCYYVVAKIESLESSHMYEFNGTSHGEEDGEEVEIKSDVSKNFIATGRLIDVEPAPGVFSGFIMPSTGTATI